MATDIELYEALKPKLGEEGARMVAERFGEGQEAATKADIGVLKSDIEALRSDFKSDFAAFRTEMKEFRAEIRTDLAEFKAATREWMLRYFIPLWIGVYGTMGALIVTSVIKS